MPQSRSPPAGAAACFPTTRSPLPAWSAVSSYPPVPASLFLPKSTGEMLSKQIRPHSANQSPPGEESEYAQPFLFSLGMKGAGEGETDPRRMICALQQRLQISHRKICLVLLKERLNQTSRLFILKHICLLPRGCTKLRQGELQQLPFSGQPVPNFCSSHASTAHV